MAAPLLALREGHSGVGGRRAAGAVRRRAGAAGAAAGRLADRHGYHRPMRVAVGADRRRRRAGGARHRGPAAGCSSSALVRRRACFTGAGTNLGLIAIQRTGGSHGHRQRRDLKRIFSWLGLAPALANVVGPVLAGSLIDARRLSRSPSPCCCCCRWLSWSGRAACRVRARAPQRRRARAATALGPARRAGLQAAAGRQLAAVVELGRAHLRWCRCSATSAASAPRRSASSSASSRSR